eukprot:1207894-Pyramimonas_sp.AAC.1
MRRADMRMPCSLMFALLDIRKCDWLVRSDGGDAPAPRAIGRSDGRCSLRSCDWLDVGCRRRRAAAVPSVRVLHHLLQAVLRACRGGQVRHRLCGVHAAGNGPIVGDER